jgi:membrane protein implicated in regulation of membrane protease activity
MEKAALVWLTAGVLCIVVEIATPTFGWVLVGAGALVSCAVAAAGYGFIWQLTACGGVSALLLIFLRPHIMRKLGTSPGVPSRTDKLVGRTARVTEAIDPVSGNGRVLVDGHDWAAQSGETIAVGAEVTVEGADGIRLRVRR